MTNIYLVDSGLSSDLLKAVEQYALFDEFHNFNPDSVQSNGMHYRYADPLMESILLLLKPTIEKIVNKNIAPTYSYYRIYRNGSDLKNHIDRPACEISATLNFAQNTKNNWPIYMGDEMIEIPPGFMVIYPGCDIHHRREPLICDDSNYIIQGFFHFVDMNGKNKDCIFDKRNGIGFPKNYKKYIIKS